MNPTERELLRRTRDILSDPSRVVRDAANLFEDSEGFALWHHDPDSVCRACFVGAIRVAAYELLADATHPQGQNVLAIVSDRVHEGVSDQRGTAWGMTWLLHLQGAQACVAICDELLAVPDEQPSEELVA